MSTVRIVLVTAPEESEAERMCGTLLEERLIACGNIVPGVRSLYRWDGRVRDENEVLLVMKTSVHRIEALVSRVPEIHPYEVPEVVVLGVDSGYRPYLDWVLEETTESEKAEG